MKRARTEWKPNRLGLIAGTAVAYTLWIAGARLSRQLPIWPLLQMLLTICFLPLSALLTKRLFEFPFEIYFNLQTFFTMYPKQIDSAVNRIYKACIAVIIGVSAYYAWEVFTF
jgi:hypothetical protein